VHPGCSYCTDITSKFRAVAPFLLLDILGCILWTDLALFRVCVKVKNSVKGCRIPATFSGLLLSLFPFWDNEYFKRYVRIIWIGAIPHEGVSQLEDNTRLRVEASMTRTEFKFPVYAVSIRVTFSYALYLWI
jgi:hypothetical protein